VLPDIEAPERPDWIVGAVENTYLLSEGPEEVELRQNFKYKSKLVTALLNDHVIPDCAW
jgi:hypothetical protein